MSTRTHVTSGRSVPPRRLRIAVLLAVVLGLASPSWGIAEQSKTRSFLSSADAAEALFQAVQSGDDEALEEILGDGSDLTSCGDKANDKRERDRFVQKYQEMRRLILEPDGSTVLYIGAENWPFPIPLISSEKGRWHFDPNAGKREVLFRRIGADEATAIEVCRAAVEAMKQNGTATSNDPVVKYARTLVGAGRASGDPPGHQAPAVDAFHGYRFIIRNTGRIRVIAYPAEYRRSGVMTFVADQDGNIYQRDLGPGTPDDAPRLTARHGSSWHPVG
jgi:hypothetical protein